MTVEENKMTETKEAEPVFSPYEMIKPIEELGNFKYDPEEDEISASRMKFEIIKMKIEGLLKLFKDKNTHGEHNTWSEYLDAKSYLEGRLHSVNYVLERINGVKN